MEFFKIINTQTTQDNIQKEITFENLDELCSSIFILESKENTAQVGSLWGEFSLHRDKMRGGLRFSFLECPNALAFTFTTGFLPEPDQIVLHLTINRTSIAQEFTEEIEEFMMDWKHGIEKYFS